MDERSNLYIWSAECRWVGKGDRDISLTNLKNVVVAFIFIISWSFWIKIFKVCDIRQSYTSSSVLVYLILRICHKKNFYQLISHDNQKIHKHWYPMPYNHSQYISLKKKKFQARITLLIIIQHFHWHGPQHQLYAATECHGFI